MDAVTILIGIGIFVASALAFAFVVNIVVLRPHLATALRKSRQVIDDREVFSKAYEFTTSTSAQQVIDAIERRWGRTVPDGAAGYYVRSVVEAQQVILQFGNTSTPGICPARIDFESRDPAAGTLWFFDAVVLSKGTEAAEQLRAELARLIAELSPGSVLQERSDPVVIATWRPDDTSADQPPRNRHRRK